MSLFKHSEKLVRITGEVMGHFKEMTADIDIAQSISPRLTTVRVVKKELGEFAVKILDDRIAGRHTHPIKVQFPCELVVRESSIQLNNMSPSPCSL